jgi:CRISPR-associated protein Cas2
MIILSYDISNDKLRTKFSKFISKFGHRIQFSVYEIDNSATMLTNSSFPLENLT